MSDKAKINYTEEQKVIVIVNILEFSVLKILFLKKIILEYCLKYSDRLYEKYTSSVNRKSQGKAWEDLVKEIETVEDIPVENVAKFKQNITNWVRRATVSAFF